jgi:hypothetical protein
MKNCMCLCGTHILSHCMSHIGHKNGMKRLTILSYFYTRILACQCQLGSMCPLTFITKLDNGYVIMRLIFWSTPRCWTKLMAKTTGELPSMLTRPPSSSQPIFRNWGKMIQHYAIIELRNTTWAYKNGPQEYMNSDVIISI